MAIAHISTVSSWGGCRGGGEGGGGGDFLLNLVACVSSSSSTTAWGPHCLFDSSFMGHKGHRAELLERWDLDPPQ